MAFPRFWWLTSVLLFSLSSHAMIDMRNANFSDSWTDVQVKGSAYDLRLQRTYNSRTLFNGMLGFGWCTEFETTLVVTPENALRVTECGAGFEADYTPSNFDSHQMDKNVSAIMAEVRKRNKGRDEAYFKNLEREVKNDTSLRDEFAKQMNITGKVAENAKYVTNGRANDYVIYKNKAYTRYLPNGSVQKFNPNGRMAQITDKNGNFLKLNYNTNGTQLISVTDNNGNSLQFKYMANSKYVEKIVGPNNLSASYKYKGENLIWAKNEWAKEFRYDYDNMYNMTKAGYPDGTSIAMTYNNDKDWVTSYTDRSGCVEKYTYTNNEKDPDNNYRSAVQKTCNGKVTNNSSFEFWHKIRKDSRRYLFKTRAEVNGKVTETTYHELFGRPIEIIQDNIITRYEYYSNGLLSKKSDPARVFLYKYDNPCTKISQVIAKYTAEIPLADNGNRGRKPSEKSSKMQTKLQSKTITTDFSYDQRRCNLSIAKNSDGMRAELGYDMHGRITKITDQSKKEVNITYDERFGKPLTVNRPGLGMIKFKYKADGSVEKFDSEEDPLVAVQVASIFSNLLELIAPATSDTNNI